MPDFSKIFLFRMTHIENIPHILKFGITHKTSPKHDSNYKPIGDSSIINTRDSFLLNNGNNIGEYIPFYFWGKMPMLYVIQNGFNFVKAINPENIVYVISSVHEIIEANLDFVFTDGHAIDSFSRQYSKADIGNISNILDFNAIRTKYWKDENDLDLKRRKEAEFLVLGDINVKSVLGYFVYNQKAVEKLRNFGVEESKIYLKSHFYF